ncbi:hypothetical protein KQI82_03370 [Oscillibacter sp. MSJ-2]|uniref:Lipoprotein n=1 Tax=Dysosmobacter acutus TaxID=2841504 RepID=A0ABS6F6S1_9FIRM|nr:hypothetical protein [Dysosmobacter acutus]MBU5625979.1 hypothetical protein [Dysosmobacter acutus]
MKKLLRLTLILLLLGGCAGPDSSSGPSSSPGMEMEAIDQWPDNAYTELLPEPETGTPDYVIEGDGTFAVFWKDITREQGEEYLGALEDSGFNQAAGESEEESAAFLMQKDGASVAVSICEGTLGLAICLTE